MVDKTTLQPLVRNHLPVELRLSRKDIDLDIAWNRSKLFTTAAGACRVILASKHPDRFEVLDNILQRIDDLESEVLNLKTKLKPPIKEVDEQINDKYHASIYSIFKLGTPVVKSSKNINFHYYYISCHARDVKSSIKRFREVHENSMLLLKMVYNGSNPIRNWELSRQIYRFRNYFNINKGHEDILDIYKLAEEDEVI